jgi:hypothetical protein
MGMAGRASLRWRGIRLFESFFFKVKRAALLAVAALLIWLVP